MATGAYFDFTKRRFFIKPLLLTGSQLQLSSYVAGALSRAVVNPFEVVQTITQVCSKEGRKDYSEMVNDINRKEGIPGFFTGNLLGTLRFFGSGVVHVAAYSAFRAILADDGNQISDSNFLIANSLSSVISSIVTYPLETIRTRMILDIDQKKYTSFVECLNTTVHEEGYSALFKGVIPFTIGNFLVDDLMDALWILPRGIQNPTQFGIAALAATISMTMYYPIDTVVKMVQAPSVSKKMRPDIECSNSMEAASNTIDKHGIMSLFRGYPVALLKVVPGILTAVLSYEASKYFFNFVNDKYGLAPIWPKVGL